VLELIKQYITLLAWEELVLLRDFLSLLIDQEEAEAATDIVSDKE
jgi:hypothetical protein